MVNNKKKFRKVKSHMLFSELNKINLNVLMQDLDGYEEVPDLLSCYVHNANKMDWTIWSKEIDQNTNEEDESYNGWKINRLSEDNIEDSYLRNALSDISANLTLIDDENGSDIVKIYAGKFDVDGTIDYSAFIENEDIIPEFRHPHHHDVMFHRGCWWTFNNGAFQWIGGWPKSIPECRFSYGPFCGPDPHHHHDNNHKMLDDYVHLSKLPNLNFIFDTEHVLKGIVSLPCASQELMIRTKTFIEEFLMDYQEMSFENIDSLLKDYSNKNAYFPTISVA
jgi:hypothetical protein